MQSNRLVPAPHPGWRYHGVVESEHKQQWMPLKLVGCTAYLCRLSIQYQPPFCKGTM